MKTEREFRVWDKEQNKYFEPIYEAYRGVLSYLTIGLGGSVHHVTIKGTSIVDWQNGRWEVEEYTGMKDKAGVKIFDGDIVEFLWKPLEDMDGKLEKAQCEIIWSKQGAWCLKWKDGYENGARLTPEKYMVIGNIHENK